MIYEWMKQKVLKKHFLKSRINGDMLIIVNDELEIYYLNQTARHLFETIDNKKTLNDIEKEMLNIYDVSVNDLRNDLVDIIRDLQWKKLLTLEE